MGKDKKKSGLGKFIFGAAIGAGIGILFAPQEGSKTRKQLKEKLDDLVETVKTIDPSDVKETIENKIEEIKNELADLDKEKVLAVAKNKAESIAKKADELVKLAIKKGTPVLENAAKEVRTTTIKVLKDTVAKLESMDKPKKSNNKKKNN